MRRGLIALFVAGLMAACGKAAAPPAKPAPLTQRQHDSAIGSSGLPGATGIHSAQRVADSMAARRARIDSASQPEQE